ncbi:hypothetical protein [Siphonobacter sp. SORGH_AS_0500]|uniref:hypothetical protein n=1 Tax=Siphonobacter sp. SORGH_AS_0500 TaxID=1864824 RepID=UPI00285D9BEB|nr:hypothetical protein [Siphonobacter sp. SORGH_AS_0500]MDR6195331.1 hypothetical protein [Siphonobacter sp. SORGH_AS_0500]
MKQFLLSAGLMLATVSAYAQLGVGTSTPKAQLDVTASNPSTPSNTDGLLIPRVSAFSATNPTAEQNGMMVFLKTASGNKLPGFYYWNESTKAWKSVYSTSETLKFYHPFSALDMDSNYPMRSINLPSVPPSTRVRTGLNNVNDIIPQQIGKGTSITGGVLSIVKAKINSEIATYPCYAVVGIYREDVGQRELIGYMEFEISASTYSSLGVITLISNSRTLMSNGTRTSDGFYQATNVTGLVLTTGEKIPQHIPVLSGSFIGVELMKPFNNNGLAGYFAPGGLSGSNITLNRPYNQAISGYENVSLSLTIE